MVGTSGWTANEILHHSNRSRKKYSPKPVDVFSFGCLVHFLLSTKRRKSHPFGANDSRNGNIRKGERVVYLYKNLTFACGEQTFYGDAVLADILIDVCVSIEPQIRPTADEIVNHPFFWKYAKRKEYVCNQFNDFKDEFKEAAKNNFLPPRIRSLELLWRDICKEDTEFHDKIPEIWRSVELNQRVRFRNKPLPDNWKSDIFTGLMRIIRNISEHWNEFAEVDSSLVEIFEYGNQEKKNETIGLYFFENIPASFPVIYVSFMSLEYNASNTAYRDLSGSGKLVKQCEITLQKTFLGTNYGAI